MRGLQTSRRLSAEEEARIMVKITINYARCVEGEDKICAEICPADVFQVDDRTEMPIVVNDEGCILCRTCEVNCPCQAIKIEV